MVINYVEEIRNLVLTVSDYVLLSVKETMTSQEIISTNIFLGSPDTIEYGATRPLMLFS